MRDWRSPIFQFFLIFVTYLSAGCTHSVIPSDRSKLHILPDKMVSLSDTFPPAEGWSSEKLSTAREYANEIGSATVIVIYDGTLVAEWGDTTKRIMSHSVRKSLLSALYGVAVEKKLIDLDASMDEFSKLVNLILEASPAI